MTKTWLFMGAAALLTAASPSFATVGGGSTHPVGAENPLAGAAPPPGGCVRECVHGDSARLARESGVRARTQGAQFWGKTTISV